MKKNYPPTDQRELRILLAGYYGEGNLGDELILLGLIKGIKERFNDKIAITVLTGAPEWTRSVLSDENPANEKISYNFVQRRSIFNVIKALAFCDIVVIGGGGIFQDFTSNRSLYYYLFIVLISKILGKKISVCAVGIERLKSFNRFIALKILKLSDSISVRDVESLKFFTSKSHDSGSTSVRCFADLALNMEYKELNNSTADPKRIKFMFVPRKFKGKDDVAFWTRLVDMCARRYAGSEVVLSVFHKKEDTEYAMKISSLSQTHPKVILWEKPAEMVREFASSSLVVSARLHGLVLAAALNIPLVGVSADRKSDLFLKEIEQKNIYRAEDFDNKGCEIAFAVISDALRWSSDFKQKLSLNVKRLKKLSHDAIDYAFLPYQHQ